MTDILKDWLIHQLGSEVQFVHPNYVCSKFQNGVLIGKLLKNYDIVNLTEFSLLVNQDDEAIKKTNFQHLKVWLDMINISLDCDTIKGFISGKRSVIFGFLYKLCFFLECPNNLNLIKLDKQLYKSFKSFSFLRVANTKHITAIHLPYKTQYHQKDITNNSILPYIEKYSSRNTLFDNINKFECSLSVKLDSWNARGDQTCIRYLSDVKARKQQFKIYDSWRKETINKYLQIKFDSNIYHNQELLRNKSISDHLSCMSKFEEKMLDKVNNSRFIIMKHNNITIKTETKLIKDYKLDRERHNIIDEKIKLNMEKELVEINNRQNEIDRKKIMKSITQELIELSVKCGIYHKTYCRNIPKYLMEDWMEIFIKGRPLLYSLDNSLSHLLDPKYVVDNKHYSDEELKNQSTLNHRDIMNYLEGMGMWSEQELGVKTNHPSSISRIFGYMIYEVLTSLYVLPASLVNVDNIVFGPVMGVLNGEIEDILKHKLCNSLIEYNILPVVPEMALNYCLYAYYQETGNTELIQILEKDDNIISLNGNVLDDFKIIVLREKSQSVQTQTSEKIDTNYNLERIECGKTAFINIYMGKPLPKHYLIDCVLCYIKNKTKQGGCVLVGFEREEIMIFEERLAKKHFPPFGSYSHMKNKIDSILIPFKEPDLSDKGRYRSSFTSYLTIITHDNEFDDKWNDVHKYYRSQNILTLLQSTSTNIHWDNNKIELFCNVLTGKTVNWFEESNWVKCIQDMHKSKITVQNDSFKLESQLKVQNDSFKIESVQPKIKQSVFSRRRLLGKSEFDFIDHITDIECNIFLDALLNSNENDLSKVNNTNSNIFNVHLNGNTGEILGYFWNSQENNFIKNMEDCFFYRRILIFEHRHYIDVINNYIYKILYKNSLDKIKLVKHLQSDLFNIPNDALLNPDVISQSLLTVLDAKAILVQLTNKKIDKCKQLIGNGNIVNWFDRQMTSLIMVYKNMLQSEVDRIVNTLIFINSYMSKLFNKKLPQSLIPKQIEVLLSKDYGSKLNEIQNLTRIDDYFKRFKVTVNTVISKFKGIFSLTSDWLEEVKEAQNNSELLEKNSVHLKIWKLLVEMEDLRSNNQLKLILARFHKDIKEMDKCLVKQRFDMIQHINNCLQHELLGVERICNLFETAINEKLIVRHEIILAKDYFYLNCENIIYSNISPPQPFPLLEPKDFYLININDLELITIQLAIICPDRQISLVAFSNWLMSYIKYLPQIEWFNTATQVLRTMFGFTVNYIDWSDFIINCLELPYPNINDLLNLRNQYMTLERKNIKNQNHIEGTISKDDYDSVLLWYEYILPINPSVCFRYMKIKDLLFTIFSIGNKLDYLVMLLAFCKDNCSVLGLIKAINLMTNQQIMLNEYNNSNYDDDNHNHSIKFSMETLYKILMICLKNYMASDKSDIKQFLSSILNIHSDIHTCNTFSLLELLRNDEFKSLSEIGFRFKSRSLSIIVNDLNYPIN